MYNRILLSMIFLLLASVFPVALYAGVQGTMRPEGFACSADAQQRGNPAGDPLVNEPKMRELFSDEKTETAKKVKFLELWGYKRYPVSDTLEPFLLEQMKEVGLTLPILQLFELMNRRFDADEFTYAGKPFVDACLAEKRYGDLDRYFEMLERCTPVRPEDSGTQRGKNPHFDAYRTAVWRQCDSYFLHSATTREFGERVGGMSRINNYAPEKTADRFSMIMEKVKPDGGGITREVLSIMAGKDGVDWRCCVGDAEIHKLIAFLTCKDKKIATDAATVLCRLLALPPGSDVAKWWAANGADFSLAKHLHDRLLGFPKHKNHFAFQAKKQIFMGNTAYDKAFVKDHLPMILDRSLPFEIRLELFASLSICVNAHFRITGATDWDDLLETASLSLLQELKYRREIGITIHGRLVKGKIRDEIITVMKDKSMSHLSKAHAACALARPYEESVPTDTRLEDGLLVLAVLEGIPCPIRGGTDEGRKKRKEWVLMGTSQEAAAAQFSIRALEQITGRKDCGYDIEKWRAAVAELEAKAGNGGTKAAGE